MSPAPPPPMTGLVLAGGASRRMGRDKARMAVDGEPLARRVADVLERCCERVLVASGDGRRLADLHLEQVTDAVADAGPLGGILAGLTNATTPLLAVVAVDMPDASAVVLRDLAARWQGQAAVVPRVDGRLQPLHAVWSCAEAPALTSYLEAGRRSVHGFLAERGVVTVASSQLPDAARSGRFARNLNRPEDLST